MLRLAGAIFLLLVAARSVAAEEIELPRVATIGELPLRAWTLTIDVERDGSMRASGKAVEFNVLRTFLRAARPKNVLLRIDRRAPWIATQWLLIACKQGRVHRVFHAVLPTKGAEEGALAIFLPTDKGLAVNPKTRTATEPIVVCLAFSQSPIDARSLYPVLTRVPKKLRRSTSLRIDAAPNVSHGFAIAVADVAMRSGLTNLEFHRTDVVPKNGDLRAIVKRHSPPSRNPGIEVEGVVVKQTKLALPSIPRVRERYAGHAPGTGYVDAEEGTDGENDGPFGGPRANPAYGIGGGGGKPEPRATKATEAAVDRGLAWLASQQDAKSGAWRAPVAAEETAVTGLAVLAFLSGGYSTLGTIEENKYARHVRAGLRNLVVQQKKNGSFGKDVRVSAVATLALVEAYWLSGDPSLEGPAQKALDYLAHARYPLGAWGTGARSGKQNTVATIWCFSATMSGTYAGLGTDPGAFEGARQWNEKVTDPGTGRAGYERRGHGVQRSASMLARFPPDKSRGMTAAVVLSRVFLGEEPKASALVKKGTAQCTSRPPRWNAKDGSIDMGYWYFGTLAMFQVGGDAWSDWNKAMTTAILGSQEKAGGKHAGSWPPIGPGCDTGGRVYATALMTMCLESYFRYDRIFKR